jgi:hypothetical protein
LNIDQTLRIDAVLQLGETTTQMEVNSTPFLLETDSSSLGQVMDQQRVKDLPLNQRQFLALTLLVPGASTPAYGSFNLSQGGAIHVNGPVGSPIRFCSTAWIITNLESANTPYPHLSRRSRSSRCSLVIPRQNLGVRQGPKST